MSEGERHYFIKRLREDGYDELANVVAVPAQREERNV